MNISLALLSVSKTTASYTTCSAVGYSTDFLAQKRAKEFTANLFTVEISGVTAQGAV